MKKSLLREPLFQNQPHEYPNEQVTMTGHGGEHKSSLSREHPSVCWEHSTLSREQPAAISGQPTQVFLKKRGQDYKEKMQTIWPMQLETDKHKHLYFRLNSDNAMLRPLPCGSDSQTLSMPIFMCVISSHPVLPQWQLVSQSLAQYLLLRNVC